MTARGVVRPAPTDNEESRFAEAALGHYVWVTDVLPAPGTRSTGGSQGGAPTPTIGWYVHHHGRGHLARCRSVAAHLPGLTVLSSLPAESRELLEQAAKQRGGRT